MAGNANPAPLLSATVVEQIKQIAAAIRSAEVAPLIGAGTSVRAGLPAWNLLVRRMIRVWRELDNSAARHLSEENYVRLFLHTFENSDLTMISYLRSQIATQSAHGELRGFGQLLYSALYAHPVEDRVLFTPEPDHVHRHLVTLFADRPGGLPLDDEL